LRFTIYESLGNYLSARKSHIVNRNFFCRIPPVGGDMLLKMTGLLEKKSIQACPK